MPSLTNQARMHCTGWWEQQHLGRRAMAKLTVAIAPPALRGTGLDVVGPFTLDGAITADGGVTIAKTYVGSHTVHYAGQYDGEGHLWGTWSCGSDAGRWMISVGHATGDADLPTDIADIRPPRRPG